MGGFVLLLVTIGLVVIGAVSLVIGFVSNSLGPIYISIACSVIAGIVLVVFSRMARRQESTSSAAAPAPTRSGSWTPSAPASSPAPTPAPSWEPSPPPRPSPPPPRTPEPPAPAPEPAPTPRARPEPAFTRTITAPPEEDEDFPIAGYNRLRASQILEELEGLTLDELDMVREREERGKNRATIIRRVDLRIDQLEAEESAAAADAELAAEPPMVDDEPVPLEEDMVSAPQAADDDFPIPGYDDRSVDEIIAVLDDLDDDELDMVAEREERGRNRAEILNYIDDMFEEVGPDGEPLSPRPAAPADPVKKAGKKATVKKAAVKKVGVKKATAKKAPLPPTPVKATAKAAATKAPARKSAAAAKDAAAGAAGTAKASARKAAGPVASPGTKSAGRRTAAAKKVTPAKVTPAKLAAKKAGGVTKKR